MGSSETALALELSSRQAADFELLANGGFAPLTGFLGSAEHESVCRDMRLASGELWSIPITLATDLECSVGDVVELSAPNGKALGRIRVSEVYDKDVELEAEQVYRTTDNEHPGVAAIRAEGARCIAGRVEADALPDHDEAFMRRYQTPAESRAAFAERGGATEARPTPGRAPLARAAAGSAGLRARRPLARLAFAVALLAAGLAAALSPAGAAVGDWIGDRFSARDARSAPAFAALPPGGSALAISHSGAYAIRPDGSTRRLGAFSEAGWSPHGLHVVGVDGRRLVAVDAAGTVKWMLTSRAPVGHPSWSTGLGYAVAYLEGRSLKVVAGNGDPATDHVLRRDAAPVTPAWRPHSDRVLTYATRAGALAAIDVQTGRTLWTAPGAAGRVLEWARGGRRLVALRSSSVTVLDRSGHIVRTIPLSGVARAMALHPSGKRAAVVVGRRVLGLRLAGGRTRQLFQGRVDGIAWSQDGRRLLLAWRDADQWLLLGPTGRITALHGVSGELGAAGGFPRVVDWCCAR